MNLYLKRWVLAITTASVALGAHAASTLAIEKIKTSVPVTMGVRESSIPMSYTTGDSRFDAYHIEICRMIFAAIKDR